MTTPMEDTTPMASPMGAMPGTGFQPVRDSTAASASPAVATILIP